MDQAILDVMRVMRGSVFFGVLLVASIAMAQTRAPKGLTETLTGDAKTAYDAGKLLFGDGDYTGAEIKFKAAYEASSDARLLWNMAACEKSLRHYARTEALVRDYVDKGGALLTDQDRADAKALLETIDSFTVKLTVNVSEEGAEVFIDDVSAGKTPLAKPVVVDIGSRKIAVRKDGFKDFEQQVPVGGAATAKLDVKLEARVHEGSVHIVTLPVAEISIDGKSVGVGRYDGKLRSGGHTLRIVASGMRAYQSELVVNDDETRAIDVPLEREVVIAPQVVVDKGPSLDLGLGVAGGARFHGDTPGMFATRIDVGWRIRWPTHLGIFFEGGALDASGNCASNVAGASSNSVDLRYSFVSCNYIRPGVEFVVHILPQKRIDPYFAFEGSFRFTFYNFHAYDPLALSNIDPKVMQQDVEPGIDVGGRVGVEVHPLAWRPWTIGAQVTLLATVTADDRVKVSNNNVNTNTGPGTDANDFNGPYVTLLVGVRTGLSF